MTTIDAPVGSPALGFGVDLPVSYADARERTIAALKEQGFGVLTEIDVRATMRQKLDVDFRPYTILGACNPPLAHRALSTDLEIGLMLPCNVVVYETEPGKSRVEFMDPVAALGIVGIAELEPVADEAKARLQRAEQALMEG
jgi:uncharacterized protein (DUF302 family)